MTARWNRRTFLRGVGGAAVAAPFLSSVWDRQGEGPSGPTQASAADRDVHPLRVHHHQVVSREVARPAGGQRPRVHASRRSRRIVGKLLIPRGIRSMNEWTQNNRGAGQGLGQGNDNHLNQIASFFTCQPVTPNSNDPFSFDSSTKFNAVPIGTITGSRDGAADQPEEGRLSSCGLATGTTHRSRDFICEGPHRRAEAGAKAYPGVGQASQVFQRADGVVWTRRDRTPATAMPRFAAKRSLTWSKPSSRISSGRK